MPEPSESSIRDAICQQKRLVVRLGGKSIRTDRFKVIAEECSPIAYQRFGEELTLFGKLLIGAKSYPYRFDVVAVPIPRRSEIDIIELKKGRLRAADLVQLLLYVNFVKHVQKYGGPDGRGALSSLIGNPRFTPRTKIVGVLAGKSVPGELANSLVPELASTVRICRYTIRVEPRRGSKIVEFVDIGQSKMRQRRVAGDLSIGFSAGVVPGRFQVKSWRIHSPRHGGILLVLLASDSLARNKADTI